MEGLAGKGKAILSLEATSTLEERGGAGLVTFSGNGGVPFLWEQLQAKGGGDWRFSQVAKIVIFSFGVTSVLGAGECKISR